MGKSGAIGPKDMNQAPIEEIKRNRIILKQIFYEEQNMDTLSHSHSNPKRYQWQAKCGSANVPEDAPFLYYLLLQKNQTKAPPHQSSLQFPKIPPKSNHLLSARDAPPPFSEKHPLQKNAPPLKKSPTAS